MSKPRRYRRCYKLRKIEYTYLIYLVVASLTHVYFAVALIFGMDTVYLMETRFAGVLFLYPIVNILWFVVSYYGYLDHFSKGFHSLSLVTFFFAGFPFLTNIIQGVTAIVGFKQVPKQYKHVQHLNELYNKKQEELKNLNNWGLESDDPSNKQTKTDPLQDFLQRDMQEYGEEYTNYLTLDEEEAKTLINQKAKQQSGVVVDATAYDVKERLRRDYDWLIPIYGINVVEELSLDELIDLAQEEELLEDDLESELTESEVTESELTESDEPVTASEVTDIGDIFLDDLL